jgi:hypothetical protein
MMGHDQYKYLPTFPLATVPFTWVSKEVAERTWFALTVAMTWAFLRLSLAALPNRRRSERMLIWITLLLNGEFLVKELGFGQFNLPAGLLLLGAVIAAQRGRGVAAGAFIAAVSLRCEGAPQIPRLVLHWANQDGPEGPAPGGTPGNRSHDHVTATEGL